MAIMVLTWQENGQGEQQLLTSVNWQTVNTFFIELPSNDDNK